MSIKNNYIKFCLCTAIVFLHACSTTKYVPDDEYLLQTATIKVDAKNITYFDLEPYIKQKENFKTFEVFKLPLFMYNLSGKDTTKWVNRVLRSGGEPPVLFDSLQIDRTTSELSRVMYNKGYLDVDVDPIVDLNNKKAKVVYDIKSGAPTTIDNYVINISDTVFPQHVLNRKFRNPHYNKSRGINTSDSLISINEVIKLGTILKKGDLFDLELLDGERDRITSLFRRHGFYDFNKEYIEFVADTLDKKNQVDLELVILPFLQRTGENNITENPHKQYYINNVDIYIDYDPLNDGSTANYAATDTIVKDNFRIFYGPRGNFLRSSAVLDNCYIQPDMLYNEDWTAMTYNALSQLTILRNINIRYDYEIKGDTTVLNCIITAIPDKKQGISTEIEGTNSAGFLGVGLGVGYSHRNAFRGSELFNVRVKSSYEAVTPSFSSFKDNYFEIGGEASITIPRFIFPFLNKETRKKLRASTQFFSSYTFQRRPNYFTRTIFSTGVKYIWENRKSTSSISRHTFDLIDISYVNIPKLYPRLEETLSTAAKLYSFTDQFIVSMGYSYLRTNANTGFYTSNKRNRSTYSLRTSFETAGNGLALISKISKIEKDENGAKKIFDTHYAQYVKGNIDFSKSIRLDDNNSLAWRLGGGIVYPYGNSKEVPFLKRFFSGGANSVRGWNIRELGPGSFYREDANFNDQSGDIRFDANVEYRSKAFWKLEFAAFLDAGNIWTIKGSERQYKGEFKFDKFYKQIASAWGLGIRLDFDFVLIRLDCGWKLYDPADIPIYKLDASGYHVIDGYQSKWRVLHPLKIKENTAWHIAVGYPF